MNFVTIVTDAALCTFPYLNLYLYNKLLILVSHFFIIGISCCLSVHTYGQFSTSWFVDFGKI